MAICQRTSAEQTIALQSFSNLVPGDRYHVELTTGEDFIGFLLFQYGPFMNFIGDKEYNIGPLDIRRIQLI